MPVPVPVPVAAATLARELRELGATAGLDVVRMAGVEPFEQARRDLEERKARGLHAGMAFTYHRPERSTTPAWALPGARTLVVAARGYGHGPVDGPAEDESPAEEPPAAPPGAALVVFRGRIAKSAAQDEYALLRAGLRVMARHLKRHGYRARVLADDNTLVDRAAAHRAGIGWWGKNTLILLPGAGSFFVLGSVLTDAALPLDEGPLDDRCGRCARCIPACPTGALVAPGVLDARRCLSWVLEAPGMIPLDLREAVGDRIYGCDECQDVCPPNRVVALRRARGAEPPTVTVAAAGGSGTSAAGAGGARAAGVVDLAGIVLASDGELIARFGHFYLAGRDVSLLRRNALVALGNVARGAAGGPRVTTALTAGLADGNAVVRAHAVWACARLGRRDLVEDHLARRVAGLAAGAEDELVEAELAVWAAQPATAAIAERSRSARTS